MEKTKEELIQAEYRRVKKLFASIPKNEQQLLDPLMQNAAFMKVTMEELQQIINEQGCSERYQNGANQGGYKTSAHLQSYNAIAKNYMAAMDKLKKCLPVEEQRSSKLAELMGE